DEVLGEGPSGGDPADLVGAGLREPHSPVRTSGDASRAAVRRGDDVLGEDPSDGNSPNLVTDVLREPQSPVRASGDAFGGAIRRGNGVLLPHDAALGRRCDYADDQERGQKQERKRSNGAHGASFRAGTRAEATPR